MKYRALSGWWLACGVLGLAAALCGAPPPLKVDKKAPLLLDSRPPAPPPKSKLPAGRRLICFDCHGNFRQEPFAANHAARGVTCVDCHGESREHSADEGNVTPPEVMYSRESIIDKCRECHSIRNAVVPDVLVRRRPSGVERIAPKDVVCTDCHGQHFMNVRTVRWDKQTGQLLVSAPPPTPPASAPASQ
jgi:hypothetical protein